MRPLQDQCVPTPYEDVKAMFLSDMGRSLSETFDAFNPEPIGVASLAQVHVGHHRQSGKTVAVKVCLVRATPESVKLNRFQLQHPHLAEFCEIDMEMVEVTLGISFVLNL